MADATSSAKPGPGEVAVGGPVRATVGPKVEAQQWNGDRPAARPAGASTSAQKPVAWTSRRSGPRPPKS